jgi:nucleotide-binding universal stress UspA family protein
MLKQITVGIDGSKDSFDAFKQALDIAERIRGTVHPVFVADVRKTQVPIVYAGASYDASFERIYIPPDPDLRRMYEKMRDDLRQFGENCMRQCAESAELRGIQCSTVVREGYPSEQLAEESRSGDLLIVGQRGENSKYRREIVGSTTEEIVRTAPRPVLVCPSYRGEVKTILFAYDRSRTAESALQFYVNTARNLASDFVMLLVDEGGSHPPVDAELAYLHEHDVPVRLVSRKGHPTQLVVDVAEEIKADIILVGAHGTAKIKDYILGATTINLVRKSTVPVLIVY